MEILLKKNINFNLIFKAENVNVCEDIEERIYAKTEDGKTDYVNVIRDIKTDVIEQFVSLLEDLISNREADYDSRDLIGLLFNKLPLKLAKDLIKELNSNYEIDTTSINIQKITDMHKYKVARYFDDVFEIYVTGELSKDEAQSKCNELNFNSRAYVSYIVRLVE